ncbi:MAG: lytic transglycosylase domain-containing protein, partial [Burkholderiaceae bacterium]
MGSDSVVGRSLRTAGYQVSEFVHVCAIYLGIAVLVTAVLSMAVPSLREQARQIHEALIIALRPDGLKQEMLASLANDALDGRAAQGGSDA